MDGSKRLYQVLSDLKYNLLLFAGLGANEAIYTSLSQVVEEIQSQFPSINVYLVIQKLDMPSTLNRNEFILLDAEGNFHQRYRAFRECLYLIRPDGYIGYRSLDIRVSKLTKYLQKVYLLQKDSQMRSLTFASK